MDKFSTYNFIVDDEDEVMLIMYTKNGEPKSPRFKVNFQDKSGILIRNDDSAVIIPEISDDVIDSLQDDDSLMVCELTLAENDNDANIAFAYEADIAD